MLCLFVFPRKMASFIINLFCGCKIISYLEDIFLMDITTLFSIYFFLPKMERENQVFFLLLHKQCSNFSNVATVGGLSTQEFHDF